MGQKHRLMALKMCKVKFSMIFYRLRLRLEKSVKCSMIFYRLPELWKVCNKFQFNRQRFVEWQYPDNHDYLDMSQGELLKLAKKYAENLENLNVKIKTRRSDEVWYLVLLFSFSLPISAGIPVATGESALEHWEWRNWDSTRRGPRKLQQEQLQRHPEGGDQEGEQREGAEGEHQW